MIFSQLTYSENEICFHEHLSLLCLLSEVTSHAIIKLGKCNNELNISTELLAIKMELSSFDFNSIDDVPHQKFVQHMYFRNDIGVRLLEQVRYI